MARHRTTFDLTLPARDSRLPASRWLYAAVRAEILEGRLKPGAQLPSSRDLAEQYDLARGTVVIAFQQLESEGYTAGTV